MQICEIMGLAGIFGKSIDCEQSVFFFRFSKGSARARERALSGEAMARASPVSSVERPRDGACVSRLEPSVTRVVICVSGAFCSTDQEKRETARSLERVRRNKPPCQKLTC